MREVAGALERPTGTAIEIERGGDTVTVHIPRPRMPLLFHFAMAFYAVGLIVLFATGFSIFVLGRPFPGFSTLFGDYHPLPVYWEIFGLTGWLTIFSIGALNIYTAVLPITHSERISFRSKSIELEEVAIMGSKRRTFPYSEIGAFRDRRDPHGLIQSELIMLLNRPSIEERGDEIELGEFVSEAEKQWLTSVLIVLLREFKGV